MAEPVAETERLRLRTWEPKDRQKFVRHLNIPSVMRWLGGVQDEPAYTAAFDRWQALQRDYGHTFWIVERKRDDELLGFCGLKRVNSPGGEALHGAFEIGWRLREDAWGQGYAKEAAIASLDLAFGRYHAPFVFALTVPGNTESQGLMVRLGMIRRPDLDFVGQFVPGSGSEVFTVVHRIDAADWSTARATALR
ncbi:MAG TPA: GNAT family N-acetyltransferase [Sphingomicrobium sp.]|jgi:RimJ/RimL family protein N-acetyltransferase|nr:GNAT family N-acetyltransferase [Sphingomicrobium sp.]